MLFSGGDNMMKLLKKSNKDKKNSNTSDFYNINKMIFCNIGWSLCYQGDAIYNGGSYVKEEGYGYEIYNFKDINGKVYGYARTQGSCDLTRLEPGTIENMISGVLVVFTATYKKGGTYIVGWYKNADFYQEYQETRLKERRYNNEYLGYITITDSTNAVLLPEHIRFSFPQIPRRVKGGMGTSSIWYADSPEMETFKKSVFDCIQEYEIKQKKNKNHITTLARQSDIDKKKKIEKIAVDYVVNEYEKQGFNVVSVEDKNYGWDLEARINNIRYKIEVKGLSGDKVSIELSENEYKSMKIHKEQYRLCIVCGCLNESPSLYIFSYSTCLNCWQDESGKILNISERISAHCYL